MRKRRNDIIPIAGLASAPRADLEPIKRINRRGRRLRVVGWIILALVVPTLLLAMIGAVRTSTLVDDVDKLSKSVTGSGSRGVAQVALIHWLKSAPAGKDLSIVAWEGSRVVTTTQDKADPDRSVTVEIHSFMVVSQSDKRYRADVAVATDSRGGAVDVGSPSLIPVTNPIGDGWDTAAADGELAAGASNENIEAAARRWLEAYTSADPDALRLATGDPDPAHAYDPIARQSGEMEISRVLAIDSGDSSAVVARVRFEIFGEVVDPESPSATTTTTAPGGKRPDGLWVTMDLRVDRANTGSPTVTAWGAVGDGGSLVAYQNATTGDRPPLSTTTTEPPTTTAKKKATTTTAKRSATDTTVKGKAAPTTRKGG